MCIQSLALQAEKELLVVDNLLLVRHELWHVPDHVHVSTTEPLALLRRYVGKGIAAELGGFGEYYAMTAESASWLVMHRPQGGRGAYRA